MSYKQNYPKRLVSEVLPYVTKGVERAYNILLSFFFDNSSFC